MMTGMRPLRSCSLSFFLLLLVVVNVEAYREVDTDSIVNSTEEYRRQNGISHFRMLNRKLHTSPSISGEDSAYLYVNITSKSPTIMDDEMVNVTIGGVLKPKKSHWVAMISPSDSK